MLSLTKILKGNTAMMIINKTIIFLNKCDKKTAIVLVAVIEVLVYILSFFTFFILNENQLLYLSSTGAQVVASLIGLTITGYIFLESKLNEEVAKDDTLVDTIYTLKASYRRYLLCLSISSILTISLCLFNIVLGTKSIIINIFINNFVLNNTLLLFFISIIGTVHFVWIVLDPDRNKKASDFEKSEVESNYEEQRQGNLSEFLKIYSEIESLLGSIAEKRYYPGEWKHYSNTQSHPIYRSFKILSGMNIVSDQLLTEIEELRKYRNLIIHGSHATVNKAICNKAERVLSEVKEAIKPFNN